MPPLCTWPEAHFFSKLCRATMSTLCFLPVGVGVQLLALGILKNFQCLILLLIFDFQAGCSSPSLPSFGFSSPPHRQCSLAYLATLSILFCLIPILPSLSLSLSWQPRWSLTPCCWLVSGALPVSVSSHGLPSMLGSSLAPVWVSSPFWCRPSCQASTKSRRLM